jgi:hypothetical protein
MTLEKSYKRRRLPRYKHYPVCSGNLGGKYAYLCDIDTQLPAQVDYFHSLVPLDLNHQKNAAIFGYPSWVYKAQSTKDGNYYALRRLEGNIIFLNLTFWSQFVDWL